MRNRNQNISFNVSDFPYGQQVHFFSLSGSSADRRYVLTASDTIQYISSSLTFAPPIWVGVGLTSSVIVDIGSDIGYGFSHKGAGCDVATYVDSGIGYIGTRTNQDFAIYTNDGGPILLASSSQNAVIAYAGLHFNNAYRNQTGRKYHVVADNSHLILSSSAGSQVAISGALVIMDWAYIYGASGFGVAGPSYVEWPGQYSYANFSGHLILSSAVGSTVCISSSLKISDNNGIIGITNGLSASAGFVGELIEAVAATGSVSSWAALTAQNITFLSLSAGDWDVSGHIVWEATTATAVGGMIATITTGSAIINSGSDGRHEYPTTSAFTLNNGSRLTQVCPTARFLCNATTVVYLVGMGTTGFGANIRAGGRMRARRMR